MQQINATPQPFPTLENDELYTKYGQQPRMYSAEELETAAISWHLFKGEKLSSTIYLKLLATCECSMSEAIILWDALSSHRKHGLIKYVDRNSSHYTSRFSASCGVERTYRRALADLFEQGLIVKLPIAASKGYRFRVDWVQLSQRLNALQDVVFPGLDMDMNEVNQ